MIDDVNAYVDFMVKHKLSTNQFLLLMLLHTESYFKSQKGLKYKTVGNIYKWSKEGKGFFRYQDPITKEIITMNDAPGWTVKCGYYGSWHEKDRIYWHCANAKEEERFTLGYIIPHEGMWQDMIDDIQSS